MFLLPAFKSLDFFVQILNISASVLFDSRLLVYFRLREFSKSAIEGFTVSYLLFGFLSVDLFVDLVAFADVRGHLFGVVLD